MTAGPSFLAQWEQALVFRIGEGDGASLGQLPDPRSFPQCFPTNDLDAPCMLGRVLGVAVLKLCRPWPAHSRTGVSFADDDDGWLVYISNALATIKANYAESLTGACLVTLWRVLDMALNAPDRLPFLIERVDALDNEALHAMAMQAVKGCMSAPDFIDEVMA